MKRQNDQYIEHIHSYPRIDPHTKSLNSKSSLDLHEKIQNLLEVFDDEKDSIIIQEPILEERENKDSN